MTRRLTLLFSVLEALLVAGIGLAIPLVPLTILWAVQYGFAPDWTVFWRTSADIWLVGHGVDLTLVLDPKLALAIGQSAPAPVVITMAALGFGTLTLLLGARAGRRIRETGHPLLGSLAAVIVFAVISIVVAWSARLPDAVPSLKQAAVLPPGVFLVGILVPVIAGLLSGDADQTRTRLTRTLRRRLDDLPPRLMATVAAGLRAGTAAVAITVAVSAVAVAVLIFGGYATLIRLYEGLHADWAGALALTAGQLAILPNLVVWALSWFIGPGFAIGAGSSVSPLGTALGPIPAIPVLGALPSGQLAFGFAGLLVPVAAGFLAGIASRRGLERRLDADAPIGWRVLAAVLGGVTGGVLTGLLAWASAGSAGPGRFARVGPDPVLTGAWAALEFAVAIGLGIAAGSFGSVAGGGRRETAPRAERPRREKVSTRSTSPSVAVANPDRAHHDDVDTAPVPVVTASSPRGDD